MTRAWVVDLIAALITASLLAGLVAFFGAPTWAAIGFGLVYYLLRPPSNQLREAARMGKVA